MRVEFIESEFWGAALLVAEADFKLAKTKDPERRWVEILVSNNNQPQRVLYADENGYHLIHHAHFNPKAAAAIQKRHKEARKK